MILKREIDLSALGDAYIGLHVDSKYFYAVGVNWDRVLKCDMEGNVISHRSFSAITAQGGSVVKSRKNLLLGDRIDGKLYLVSEDMQELREFAVGSAGEKCYGLDKKKKNILAFIYLGALKFFDSNGNLLRQILGLSVPPSKDNSASYYNRGFLTSSYYRNYIKIYTINADLLRKYDVSDYFAQTFTVWATDRNLYVLRAAVTRLFVFDIKE